jgi:DNA-binding NarL/FixJ family response regulator
MLRIAIVENEPLLREMLHEILTENAEVTCVGAFASGEAALAALPALQPDVVLMDIDLGNGVMNGIECIARSKVLCTSTKFVVFTIFEDNQYVFEAISAGALGYILKSSSPQKIIAALHDVMEGGSPITPTIARKLVDIFALAPRKEAEIAFKPIANDEQALAMLTKREHQIIALIARGHTEREVADTLFISFKTVKTHITNIYQKLQVNTRVEALNKYFNR